MSPTRNTFKTIPLAVFLIVSGLVGWAASFALTIEKFHVLQNPGTSPSCDFSVVVQCGKNLASWQGAVFFGIPNPVWGVAGFVAPIAVGTALLAGARFSRWFWLAFNLGVAGAFAFVCWLIGQSIFALGTLCPWCMVVWAATIPMFFTVTLYLLGSGMVPLGTRDSGAGARRGFRAAYGWIPMITLLAFVVIAALAQVRLDLIDNLF